MVIYLEFEGKKCEITKPDNNYGDNLPIFQEALGSAADVVGLQLKGELVRNDE